MILALPKLNTFCEFQLIWTSRNGDVLYLIMKPVDIPYNFTYKIAPVTASTYSKFKSLTLKLLIKMKKI